jgi:four helix bundle protein
MVESKIQKKSFDFALLIVRLYCKARDQHEYVLSKQLLRSGTSIGANVAEAYSGQSRRDYLSKMAIACKEARETQYWLRLVQESKLVNIDFEEALAYVDELIRILTTIIKTVNEKP